MVGGCDIDRLLDQRLTAVVLDDLVELDRWLVVRKHHIQILTNGVHEVFGVIPPAGNRVEIDLDYDSDSLLSQGFPFLWLNNARS